MREPPNRGRCYSNGGTAAPGSGVDPVDAAASLDLAFFSASASPPCTVVRLPAGGGNDLDDHDALGAREHGNKQRCLMFSRGLRGEPHVSAPHAPAQSQSFSRNRQ